MSLKPIIVLYNEKESNIELNLEEITSYSLLIQKILSFFNESNMSFTYHLMSINTSNPYTLLEEENYKEILNEKIEGEDLKLFLNKINPEDLNSNEIINNEINIDNIKNNEGDNEEEEDFILDDDNNNPNNINRKEENIINSDNNNEVDTQLKIDEIKNINNNDNENKIENEKQNENDKEDLFSQTDEMLKKIDKLMENSNPNLKLLKYSKSLPIKREDIIKDHNEENKANGINKIINEEKEIRAPLPFSRKNQNLNINNIKIDDNDDNINKIADDNLLLNSRFINPETFKLLKCILCNEKLSGGLKYICCICENCILCENCEKTHFHPCIKFKSTFLSNITDIYRFMTNIYSFKSNTKNFFTKLFTKEYEIKLYPICDKKICLRPQKNFIFAIKIFNFTNNLISSSQFEIISKNNKNIKILIPNTKFNIRPNSHYTLKLKCKTKKNIKKEKVDFYLFSDSLYFKNQEDVHFTIDFEINEDWDEEKINSHFENNEYAILYSKEHKTIAIDLLNNAGNSNIEKDFIKNVFDILVKNNWNKNSSLNQIMNLK